jgi:hypothetical protein
MTQFFKMLTVAGALFVAAAPADAAMRFFLKDQWINSYGQRMCQYGNGTVLNVGARVCPLSIEG